MEINTLWKVPTKEEQQALRERLFALMQIAPRSRSSLALDSGVAHQTIKRFMVKGEDIEWVPFQKLLSLIERMEGTGYGN